jgi:ribonuclease D
MSNRSSQKTAAKPDLPAHRYIRDASSWNKCLKQLRQESRIAVDLEANSMYAYQEQICLIQVSIPGQDYIIDPLGDFDLDGFGALIEDPDVEKVFHAAEYDLMLMKREHGWRLSNLFDTMWAARILGYDRFGLASILSDVYQVRLDKRFQRANWCKRPLSREQLAYAQADTHYLLDLRDHLATELKETGRVEEAEEIFEEQSRVELPDTDFDADSFWSINGVHRLPPQGKAILRALTIFRDEQARRQDQPHFKVLHDKTLLKLARDAPRSMQALQQVQGLSHSQIRRYGEQLLRVIDENRNERAPRRPPQRPRPSDEVMRRYDALRTWRKERGLARGVESDVILSRDALWEIARTNPHNMAQLAEIEKLGPWRLRTYGEEILELLANEHSSG